MSKYFVVYCVLWYAANTVPAPLQIVREHSWYSSIIHHTGEVIYLLFQQIRLEGWVTSHPRAETSGTANRNLGIAIQNLCILCIVYRVQAPATFARPIDYEAGRADKSQGKELTNRPWILAS